MGGMSMLPRTAQPQQTAQPAAPNTFASDPYAGFVPPTQQPRLGGMTPEEWVYQNMMTGMGSPGAGMNTNQLVPGAQTSAQYGPNPYADTLATISDPTATQPPGDTPDTLAAWLAYDLNKNNKLGKKEKKAFKAADLAGFKDWKSTLAGVPGSVPDTNETPYNPYYYVSG